MLFCSLLKHPYIYKCTLCIEICHHKYCICSCKQIFWFHRLTFLIMACNKMDITIMSLILRQNKLNCICFRMTSSAPSLPVRGFGTHTQTDWQQVSRSLTSGWPRESGRGDRTGVKGQPAKGEKVTWGTFFCPSSFSASCIVSWLARACGRRRGHGQNGSGPAADFLPPTAGSFVWPSVTTWKSGSGGVEGEFVATVGGQCEVAGWRGGHTHENIHIHIQ